MGCALSRVSQLVDSLSAPTEPNGRATNQTAPNRATNQTAPTDEPLLLVRAYQEGLAGLMKLNAELSGSVQLEASFKDQIEKVNQELDTLADKQAKYEQLTRNVSVASASAEIFAKRTVEEEVSSNISAARMSNLRVVQPGARSNEPVFPKLWVMLAIGLGGGVALSVGSTFVARFFFDLVIKRGTELSRSNNSAPRSDEGAYQSRNTTENGSSVGGRWPSSSVNPRPAGAHQSRNTSDGLLTEDGPPVGFRRPPLRGNVRTAGL